MLSPTVLKNTLILYNFAKCKVHTKIEKKNVTINCQSIFFPSKIFSLNLKQSVLLPPFPKKKHRGERRCVKFNNRVTDDPIGSAIV